MHIQHHISLKPFNTFGVDVKADMFAEIREIDELEIFLKTGLATLTASDTGKILILGGGSNILFTGDFHGLILKNSLKGIEILEENEDEVIVSAKAGENWDDFVAHCVNRGFGGLENLSGIPGCVGASPMQNIGAYGAEMKDNFQFLEAFNLHDGNIRRFVASDCHFGYRDSIFKQTLKGEYLILSVAFRLSKKPRFNLDYKALKDRLAGLPPEGLSLSLVRQTVLDIRGSRLPDPSVIGNAGSFFKNPVVTEAQAGALLDANPGMVCYPAPDGKCKLAAGWLIDQCGWKGYREGDAGVHIDQALVLVNYGQATGNQLVGLAGRILDSVYETFSVRLEPEVQIH